MTYKKMFLFTIICLMVIGLQTPHSAKPVNAFTDQVIQHGAVGEHVIELQARLQCLGCYNRNIDVVFGWWTYCALRNCQYEFGIEIDGLARTKTKEKWGAASKNDKEYAKNQIKQGNDFTHY